MLLCNKVIHHYSTNINIAHLQNYLIKKDNLVLAFLDEFLHKY